MRQFSRLLRRRTLFEAFAITLAAAWIVVLAAYAYYALASKPAAGGLAAAGIVLLIAIASFLYAWREPEA
jgi:hypothetical protein